MTLWTWSQTASANGNADPTVNYLEGQIPSSLNDSARGAMAAVAKYRDDIAGAIVTGGTSTAYTVTTYQVFDSLAHLNGAMIAFTPHATNGATVTLNVDSLGAKPLRSSPNVELPSGILIQGTPYVATYNNSDAAWYLRDFYSSPYLIPLGGIIDYAGSTAPNSQFALPIGQAISRTTYATLFSLISTTYGTGDGSTTFNLPDLTGRVAVMKEASATRLTSTYFGGNSTTLGATGGADHTSNTIAQANLPNVNLTSSAQGVTVFGRLSTFNLAGGVTNVMDLLQTSGGGGTTSATYAVGGQTVPLGGSGTALAVSSVQPTIVLNKIMRVAA